MENFYVISGIGDGEDIPFFFGVTWVPALPDFDHISNNPSPGEFEENYELIVELDSLEVDIIFEQYLASTAFTQLCGSLSCSFISIPTVVKLNSGKNTQKSYSFFCLTSRYSILDEAQSSYELTDEKLLRPVVERPNSLPVYDRIDSFVIRSGVKDDLFFCEEIKQMVCSEAFKREFEVRALTGLAFSIIDDGYVYSPWDDF